MVHVNVLFNKAHGLTVVSSAYLMMTFELCVATQLCTVQKEERGSTKGLFIVQFEVKR